MEAKIAETWERGSLLGQGGMPVTLDGRLDLGLVLMLWWGRHQNLQGVRERVLCSKSGADKKTMSWVQSGGEHGQHA